MSGAEVDRAKTTPFLLRLFYRTGQFHRNDEFTGTTTLPPHVQVYTWQTCTLKELTHLLTLALPTLLPEPSVGTRLIFRLLFPDTRDSRPGDRPRFVVKDLGSVVIGAGGPGVRLDDDEYGTETERLLGDANKTLRDARFVIGDYVTVAVFPPLPNGEVSSGMPRHAGAVQDFSMGRSAFGGPSRENGYGGYGSSRRGSRYGDRGGVPPGEWRRGDIPPGGSGAYGRGRGRGRSYY